MRLLLQKQIPIREKAFNKEEQNKIYFIFTYLGGGGGWGEEEEKFPSDSKL